MEGIILFADDLVHTAGKPENKLYHKLKDNHPVFPLHNLELTGKAVNSISSFTALILDWHFSSDTIVEEDGIAIQAPDTDMETYHFLMNNNFYSLIYIYSTFNIEDRFGDDLKSKFDDRIKFRIKRGMDNVEETAEQIIDEISSWKEKNNRLLVPILWSNTINSSLQHIFKELSQASPNWIKEIYDSAKNDGVSPELFVIDLLQMVLSESVIQNRELIEAIKSVSDTPQELKPEPESIAKLFSLLMYSKLQDDAPIMTGDICTLENMEYGIIITPECDIKSVEDLELLILITDLTLLTNSTGKPKDLQVANFNQNEIGRHFLPSLPPYSNKEIKHDEPKESDYNRPGFIEFKSGVTKISKCRIENKREYKLNSPFIQQLRQRYYSYMSRVGVPALPDSVRYWNIPKKII